MHRSGGQRKPGCQEGKCFEDVERGQAATWVGGVRASLWPRGWGGKRCSCPAGTGRQVWAQYKDRLSERQCQKGTPFAGAVRAGPCQPLGWDVVENHSSVGWGRPAYINNLPTSSPDKSLSSNRTSSVQPMRAGVAGAPGPTALLPLPAGLNPRGHPEIFHL